MRSWMAAGLAVLLAAGCLDGNEEAPGVDGAMPVASPYVLDCSIGSRDWGEPCLAWSSRNDSPSKAEIDLAVNPTDPLNVFVASKDMDPLASRGPCVWAVGQVTHDGGRTWSTVYVGGTLDEREPTEPLFGWRCITDPILQFAPDGVLHYSLQAYDYEPGIETPSLSDDVEPQGGNMYTALSTDGGDSFDQVNLMHAGDQAVVFHDFMRMGVNPSTGTVFTLWNQFVIPANERVPVLVATPTSGDSRPPVYLGNPDDPGGMGINAIAGSPDGFVHAFATTTGGGQEVLLRFTSDDDGLTFGSPVEQFTLTTMQDVETFAARTGTNVEVAADTSGGPRHGCLYAVWADGAADIGDILARSSCDEGETWSDAVLVSSGPHEGAQVFPRVSVDSRGTVHVVYQTQAYHGVFLDADWAHSADGGATWTVQRLTAVPSDPDLGVHQDGGPFFGDYIGIGSSGDHTYMAFPVTVTGRAEVAVAHVQFNPSP